MRRHRTRWTGGDNVNLAVGQGDLQATPIQVAVAYAALANGGTIVRPHLGKAIEDANGIALQEFRPKPRRKIKFGRARPRAVLDGLRRAAREEDGTSADVLEGLADGRYPVYGKTGTAERRRIPTRPGTPASSRTPSGRSSSWSRWRRAASARPRRRPRRA